MRSWIGRFIRPALQLGSPSILSGNRSIDIGPYAMNWPDFSTEELTYTTVKLKVESINVPLVFSAAQFPGTTLNAYVNGNPSNDGAIDTPISGTTQFTVYPNAYVWFVVAALGNVNGQVRVRNVTANNTLIDQFNFTLGALPPP